MKRREFFAVMGGATIVGRGVGFAQQSRKVRRIGVFIPFVQTDKVEVEHFAAFKNRLRGLGWTEGRDIEIIERWRPREGNAAFQDVAADLVRQSPDLIFLVSTPVLKAVAAATKTIPIVFVGVSDPVGQGFVSNLANPGENITGFTFFEPEMGGKWLNLLKEIAPDVKRVTILFNPDTSPQTRLFLRSIDAAAQSFAVTATTAAVQEESSDREYHQVDRERSEWRAVFAVGHIHHKPSRFDHRTRRTVPCAGAICPRLFSTRWRVGLI